MKRPKVIFLDAVGTLFGVKGSVGEVYSQIAQEFGVVVPADTLNKYFFPSFKAAAPPVFPEAEPDEIAHREFNWWRMIALNTFDGAGALQQFKDFSAFFHRLYYHFNTAEPWYVYPDVPLALINWRRLGVELGVLSNFDSRLYSVLKSLGLNSYFSSITISSQAFAAKPDAKIFQVALQQHNCEPEDAWHIGDSIRDDYHGAKAAGIRGIWINRI